MQNLYKREGKGRAVAVGVIIEAIKKILDAVRLFVEVLRVLAESL